MIQFNINYPFICTHLQYQSELLFSPTSEHILLHQQLKDYLWRLASSAVLGDQSQQVIQ